ncbi:MAG: SGNH/GDSL hydrolase family protein [Planctomycetota bacterium JB042]
MSRRTTALLLAPLIGLLAAEVLVRVFAAAEVDVARLRAERVPGYLAPFTRYSDDPALYYELRPHLDEDWGGVRLRTDADGLRIPTPGAPPPRAGAVRLAVVGASVTFGHRVAYEDAYPHRLARRLEAVWGVPVDLRVFAVPGYCAEQKARLFEVAVLPWRPDLVLWDVHHRDPFPILSPDAPIGMEPEVGDNPLRSALWKLVARRRHRARIEERALGRREEHEWLGPFLVAGPLVERQFSILARVGTQAREAGVPVHAFVFEALALAGPAGEEHERRLHADLLPRLGRLGFEVLDVWPELQREMDSRGWTDQREWWRSRDPLDVHPNVEGHAWWAETLARGLAGARPR